MFRINFYCYHQNITNYSALVLLIYQTSINQSKVSERSRKSESCILYLCDVYVFFSLQKEKASRLTKVKERRI